MYVHDCTWSIAPSAYGCRGNVAASAGVIFDVLNVLVCLFGTSWIFLVVGKSWIFLVVGFFKLLGVGNSGRRRSVDFVAFTLVVFASNSRCREGFTAVVVAIF